MHSKNLIRILIVSLFLLNPFTLLHPACETWGFAGITGLICFARSDEPAAQESTVSLKQKTILFQGEINADNINVRTDSTTGSRIICTLNKGEQVEVTRELYEWYKIKLPKTAPSFIRKDLVTLIDGKTAKVTKDNVNVRFAPDESSAILGKADINEVINIISETPQWYKIEPVDNCFGWIHRKFVDKASTISERITQAKTYPRPKEREPMPRSMKKEKKASPEETPIDEAVILEGVIKPYGKVVKRVATHKLIAADNKVFLLKGNKENLDALSYHKVRITGKSIQPKGQKYATIEILKIEALD